MLPEQKIQIAVARADLLILQYGKLMLIVIVVCLIIMAVSAITERK